MDIGLVNISALNLLYNSVSNTKINFMCNAVNIHYIGKCLGNGCSIYREEESNFNTTIMWDAAPCISVDFHRRFGGSTFFRNACELLPVCTATGHRIASFIGTGVIMLNSTSLQLNYFYILNVLLSDNGRHTKVNYRNV
jgi:hypothetical protein